MTSKEKAKDLFEKYSFFEVGGYTGKSEIKDMCKLCVDEILPLLFADYKSQMFWEEVKSEIDKL